MSTNVPQPTFGPNGFVAPDESLVLAGVFADINAAFGGGLSLALETPQGQIASSETSEIGNVNNLFVLYTNLVDPAYSFGRMQDAIARIYFLERLPSLSTVVQCLCQGLPGTLISVGVLVLSTDGGTYQCTEEGTIGIDGTVTLAFANTVVGPIACPAETITSIYQSIPGWDRVENPSPGVIGRNVESRSEFEARRVASVAINAIGTLPAVRGSVLAVPGVLDAYVTENDTAGPATVGGVVLVAKSLYVCAIGGLADDIAEAIWKKKAPGCAYNGTTTVVVEDSNSGYTPPYPSYSVQFQIPNALTILFEVTIVSSTLVPADANTLIQNAIIQALAGTDGGQRALIGATLYASRFYAPIAAIGAWVQIVSIKVGSSNAPTATFTASIALTTMTVTVVSSGALAVGQTLQADTGGILDGTTILAQLTGSPGSTGTYTVSQSQTVTSRVMHGSKPLADSVSVNIDQVPVSSAINIGVDLI